MSLKHPCRQCVAGSSASRWSLSPFKHMPPDCSVQQDRGSWVTHAVIYTAAQAVILCYHLPMMNSCYLKP